MMKAACVLLVVLTAPVYAEAPRGDAPQRYFVAPARYVGVSGELSNGLDGKSEFGFAAQVAPLRYLEIEGGAIRHDIDGREGDTWLVTGAVRTKLAFGYGALFAGLGFITGEHGAANGCTSSGFLDFCGGDDTYVERHWDRAFWLKPEFGGEVALGVVAMRFAVAPLVQLADPDMESGCLECSDGQQGVLFTMGIHGRLPL